MHLCHKKCEIACNTKNNLSGWTKEAPTNVDNPPSIPNPPTLQLPVTLFGKGK